MPPQTASCGISRKGLSEDHQILYGCRGPLISETGWIWRHSLLPVGCEMQLNTAQKSCVKRSSRAESNISATVSPRPATCCTVMHADLVYSHTGYDVTSYFRPAFAEVRKMVKNAASDGFGSNCSFAAFCLPHQLMGILLFIGVTWAMTSFGISFGISHHMVLLFSSWKHQWGNNDCIIAIQFKQIQHLAFAKSLLFDAVPYYLGACIWYDAYNSSPLGGGTMKLLPD